MGQTLSMRPYLVQYCFSNYQSGRLTSVCYQSQHLGDRVSPIPDPPYWPTYRSVCSRVYDILLQCWSIGFIYDEIVIVIPKCTCVKAFGELVYVNKLNSINEAWQSWNKFMHFIDELIFFLNFKTWFQIPAYIHIFL